ncbi:MAG: hypothetical protein ABJA98_03035 [Acidobacteriota bacterium]
MPTLRSSAAAIGFAVICGAALAAQTQETKTTTKTKIEVKGGKDVTVVGCLDRGVNGDYLLTKVRAKGRDPSEYSLVTTEDLSKHVGERIEIHGKLVSQGNGTVSIESKTKTEVEHGKDSETKAKTEGAIALRTPFLGVTSTKTLGATCS